ncbi:MAG: 50S ribosomal protein L18 [Ignavibacteriales bacterium]|nr:50S ribosomal protein L18 [Ignavibacteriales bacterium]
MIRKNTEERRQKKKVRIRKKVFGTSERPRFTVYRSLNHVYAQIIDDSTGKTLVSTSTLAKDLRDELESLKSSKDVCKKIGATAAKKALEKNIKEVVFDRNGFLYHGRVKAVADGAREGGLKF